LAYAAERGFDCHMEISSDLIVLSLEATSNITLKQGVTITPDFDKSIKLRINPCTY